MAHHNELDITINTLGKIADYEINITELIIVD